MYLRNSHRVTFRLPYHGSVILFSFKPNHCFQFDWEKAVWKYFEKKIIKKSVTVGIPYRKGFAGGGPTVLLLCKAQRKGL